MIWDVQDMLQHGPLERGKCRIPRGASVALEKVSFCSPLLAWWSPTASSCLSPGHQSGLTIDGYPLRGSRAATPFFWEFLTDHQGPAHPMFPSHPLP